MWLPRKKRKRINPKKWVTPSLEPLEGRNMLSFVVTENGCSVNVQVFEVALNVPPIYGPVNTYLNGQSIDTPGTVMASGQNIDGSGFATASYTGLQLTGSTLSFEASGAAQATSPTPIPNTYIESVAEIVPSAQFALTQSSVIELQVNYPSQSTAYSVVIQNANTNMQYANIGDGNNLLIQPMPAGSYNIFFGGKAEADTAANADASFEFDFDVSLTILGAPISTATTLTSSADPSPFGQPVTFTATVSSNTSGQPTPTGSVTFMDGTTVLNPGGTTLDGTGTAAYATSSMPIGNNSVTAVYNGDSNFASSTSATLDQQVNTLYYTPGQIQQAYGFNTIPSLEINNQPDEPTYNANAGAGQTIAIIDHYNDPYILADANYFSSYFELPQFNTAQPQAPMFAVINQYGHAVSADPSSPDYVQADPNSQYSGEEAMDVEWAHAIAPSADIVLIEAPPVAADPNWLPDSLTTVQNLANGTQSIPNMPDMPKVTVVSMSFGDPEGSNPSTQVTPAQEKALDPYFATLGVTYLAGSGDYGAYGAQGSTTLSADYPAASPNVIAVGGTTLTQNTNGSYSETGWSLGSDSNPTLASGGGISAKEKEPQSQLAYGVQSNGLRTIPDVAFDADSNTGVYIYDPFGTMLNGTPSWTVGSGTSLSAPCWAGLIAIADQERVTAGGTPLTGYNQTLPALYSLAIGNSNDFNDIVSGFNGPPPSDFAAPPGYNLVTGLGTPNASALVPDLASWGVIAPNSAPAADVGKAYSQTFLLTGGNANANISLIVTSGSFQTIGLAIDAIGNGVTIGGVPISSGTVGFTVVATDSFGFTTSHSYMLHVFDTVQSVVINDGSAQRSMVNSITVTFSDIVNLMPGAFQLTNQGTGGAEGITWTTSVVNNRTVAIITFVGSDIIGGSLGDGQYSLTTNGADILTQSGVAIDAAENGQCGSVGTDSFFRLFGDISGTGTVTNADVLAFVQDYRNHVYLWYLDYDGAGSLTASDLTQIQARLGKSE
jgi:hypothetical protein